MKKILIAALFAFPAYAEEPVFQSGDIILQTSSSKQSYAIMWASKSLYSHVGIVEVDGKKKYVLEAISKVSRTPLEKWIKRGRMGRYSLYRQEDLSEKQKQAIVTGAKKYLDYNYDIFFTSKNKEIYCSELVDLAYKHAGLSVGKYEKVQDLDVDNIIVRKLVEKRWRKHPLCKKIKEFSACWQQMLEDKLITPESLALDSRLKKVWSNYP